MDNTATGTGIETPLGHTMTTNETDHLTAHGQETTLTTTIRQPTLDTAHVHENFNRRDTNDNDKNWKMNWKGGPCQETDLR